MLVIVVCIFVLSFDLIENKTPKLKCFHGHVRADNTQKQGNQKQIEESVVHFINAEKKVCVCVCVCACVLIMHTFIFLCLHLYTNLGM